MSYQFGRADSEQRVEFVADRRDGEPAPSTGRGLIVASALLVLVLFAGGLWFAYVEGTRRSNVAGGEVPLIRADARPMKVKPTDPGGLAIPDRAMLIYDPDRRMPEHLLAPPEKPVARPPPIPAATAAPVPPPSSVVAGEAATMVGPAPAPPQTAEPFAKSALAAARSETVKARPDKSGGIRLQLGSVRSEDAARQEWVRMKRHNADLLGHLSANAIRADLGDKGVYFRIQAGPVADLAAAERICGELRQRNVGCIIVR